MVYLASCLLAKVRCFHTHIRTDIFLVAVSSSEYVGEVLPSQRIRRVRNVSFFCLTRRLYNDLTLAQGALDAYDAGAGGGGSDDPCAAIRKYMTGGSFYFSDGPYDITQRVQQAQSHAPSSTFHTQFLWNAHMMEPIETCLARLDANTRRAMEQENFFLYVVQGFVGIHHVHASVPCRLAVVSRLSTKRAGTRFNARGIDDAGNAANFAETETVLVAGDTVFAYTQLRGSVPVFWEQQGLQLNARIQITRSGAASMPGFKAHMWQLLDEYGRIFALDLLGTRDAESQLALAYTDHLHALRDEQQAGRVQYANFHFHHEAKVHGGIEGACSELGRYNNVHRVRQRDGYTLLAHDDVLENQTGVFRINCFDCLDRTNIVQGSLSQWAIRDFFLALGRKSVDELDPALAQIAADHALPTALWHAHRDLWANNGDALSVINTGTGSLNSNSVRSGTKKGLTGLLSDAAKSASRMYVNNFQDQSKQEAIDTLLGQRSGQRRVELYDPRYARASEGLARRWNEYARVHDIQVLVGTYNVCAQAPSTMDLSAWLCQAPEPPDIVVVVLQEIVPLNAQQMLQSTRDEVGAWQTMIYRTLQGTGAAYEELRHEVLFGTAVLVYVQAALLPHIRNVEGTTKKTGFRGMSGNKGGAAIRFDVHDTSICCVGSHLASGANNWDERNSDYLAIVKDLVFTHGRTIDAHDHIFWAGDLNYRINMSSTEDVRQMAMQRQLAPLLEHDQLTRARRVGAAFEGYEEAPIHFPPTYKYDVGTDVYDTSEKLRAPAWTDRVLFKCTRASLSVECISYTCAQIKQSDHRPVCALLSVGVCTLDVARRNEIYAALVSEIVEDDKQHNEASRALPPPSSAASQWWNDARAPPLSPSLGDPDVRGNPFVAHNASLTVPGEPSRSNAPEDESLARSALPQVPPPIPPRPAPST